ncbi:exported hypothetical protein [Candidatus Microthrix parvicella RN1]|uniref:Uncharacterized protein n=1 Tax=Candidatus Neomicrothrix parvicella RN1 TaxID=1229780 RepID=R4Z7I8_9ACTN|nr:exported hypothetical protein [Candidatus Microthrix parvicella RN1]
MPPVRSQRWCARAPGERAACPASVGAASPAVASAEAVAVAGSPRGGSAGPTAQVLVELGGIEPPSAKWLPSALRPFPTCGLRLPRWRVN